MSMQGCQIKISTQFTQISTIKMKINDRYDGKIHVLPKLTRFAKEYTQNQLNRIESELE